MRRFDPIITHKYESATKPKTILDSIRIDNRWIVSKHFFDGFGRTIQTQSIAENDSTIVTNISYDKMGLEDSVCNPYKISGTNLTYVTPTWSQVSSYRYDALGRDTLITHPDGEKITKKYYANTDTIYDEKGNRTIHIYNAYGTIDTIIDAYDNKTTYEYDTLGRLTRVTDAENKSTEYHYDKLSRVVRMNCPDVHLNDTTDIYYWYDDLGNMTCRRDPNGWTRYTYDDISRPTKIEFSTDSSSWSEKVKMTYDTFFYIAGEPDNSKGRLTKIVTSGIDSMCYYYNDRGNLCRKDTWIVGLSGKKHLKYKYNIADLCTLMTLYPGTYNNSFHYDRLGRLKEIPNLIDTFKYVPSGQIKRIKYANDITDTISYDSRLRPTRIHAYKTNTTYLNLTYKYQANSNVDSIIDNLISSYTQAFAYDSLNRLTAVTSSVGNQSFTYDKVGNRKSKNGSNYSYYSNTNRVSQDHRNYNYSYDNNGNIIRRQTKDPVVTIDSFDYDWSNRLVYYKKDSETIDFAYDASGLRVKKHYHNQDGGIEMGELGTLFSDPVHDLGMKVEDDDSIYNKGRDVERVYIKDSAGYYYFTVVTQHLFGKDIPGSEMDIFITLDVDTIENSGIITLPEDSMTRVPNKAAWEYCIYVEEVDYGFYKYNGGKESKPLGMSVEEIPGDTGKVKITISKSLLNNPQIVRYTVSTFDPNITSNPDTLFQGGSRASDILPGTNMTFGGIINGYGQMTTQQVFLDEDYTVYYVYDGVNPIVEYSPNGSVLNRYVYGGGLHIARIAGTNTHYYHCDALGSPRKMTDEYAANIWQARYYPFGEMTVSGFADNAHGFTGKEYDSEMGLNYFCQRYYDPEIGRFMALDPQGSPASSPYAYCSNNPLIFSDPTGMKDVPQLLVDYYGAGGGFNDYIYFHGFGDFNPFAKSEDLDPDFWEPGWWLTNLEKIRRTIDWLGMTEWGQGVGSAIVEKLNFLWATGEIGIIGGGPKKARFGLDPEGPDIVVGSLMIGYGKEYLGMVLAHEGAHEYFHPALKDVHPMLYRAIQEGIAMLFEAALYGSEPSLRNHPDPCGWFGRTSTVWHGGWHDLLRKYPDTSTDLLMIYLFLHYYRW